MSESKAIVKELRDWVLRQMQSRMFDETSLAALEGEAPNTAEMGARIVERQETRLRLSHGLDCARRFYYAHHRDAPSDPPCAMVQLCKFSIGDLWEAWSHKLLPHCASQGWEYQDLDDLEVSIGGVVGHLDGIFVNQDLGLAVISDSKLVSPMIHKHWTDGLPDAEWGKLHQAGNYIAAWNEIRADSDLTVIGFVWPSLIPTYAGLWKLDVGYASAEELEPWRKRAAKQYDDARSLDAPPARLPDFPDGVCRYCEFRDACTNQ